MSNIFTVEIKLPEPISLKIKTDTSVTYVSSDKDNIVVDMTLYDVLVLNPTWDIKMSEQIRQLEIVQEVMLKKEEEIEMIEEILKHGVVQ